ncbi:PREDICTED: scarecrow-like protein 6 [Fragaria vesca subsp. vesca]|uniref:scarecrow-like protein 6 n=1 Tax=Fragaria vesca subsp. vesca TaxID=101020 RepID=UPI0002C3054C|nr:PREDICTED: scarecrow-like protein 6 [Fragaria vesca subsp. vesca]
MKAMPLPFEEFQGKGVLDFSSAASSSDLLGSLPPQGHHQQPQKWKENCYVGSTEPTSVLDTRRSPSPPTSSSTLSSSHGSGGGSGSTDTTTTTGVAAAPVENKASEAVGVEEAKCGPPLGMEDWESVLSESPGQEQSILRLIMSDIEDPSLGLNKLLQSGVGSHHDLGFNLGFEDQGYGAFEEHNTGSLNMGMSSIVDPSLQATSCSEIPFNGANAGVFSASANNLFPGALPPGLFQQQQQLVEPVDEKPQIFNPQMVMNQNQAQFNQNPAMFMPLTYSQLQDHHFLSPPPAKRHQSGGFGPSYPAQRMPFLNPGQELLSRVQQQQQQQHHQQQQQLPMLPQHLQHRPVMLATKDKMVNNLEGDKELMNNHQFHQAIIDQLVNAAELIETGNPLLAQGILARLNHQLSPIGKPFQRAALYFKEALELLLNNSHSSANLSPFSLVYKIAAYKSFSEISPVLQFANFTCNQAILESVEGYNRVHVIDFDIGYGGQWASFMQEVALRNGGSPPSLKITAFVCSSVHDEFELAFTQENLKNFASELNLAFELEIVSIEALNSGSWPLPLHGSDSVAVAVNLPIGSFLNSPLSLPLVLRFVKQLSPKIVVSLERGSDRTDIPFPHQIIQALHSYSSLLESLDAVNANLDALQKIERYLLQPSIEKIVMGRHLSPKRTPTPSWRTLFLSSGFSPLTFSNFTESQAECLVQRTPVGGFHVEKRQSSLVLCWQRKDLVSASAWRC